MNIEQAAMFLSSAILTGFGTICISIVILVVNNLFSKYWKPVVFSKYIFGGVFGSEPPRFVDTMEPTLEKVKK